VLDSNLGRDTGYPDKDFCDIPLSLQVNAEQYHYYATIISSKSTFIDHPTGAVLTYNHREKLRAESSYNRSCDLCRSFSYQQFFNIS
jgi:hypothetical protein